MSHALRQGTVYETARDNGARLSPRKVDAFAHAAGKSMPSAHASANSHAPAPTVTCDPAQTFQKIEGFGGALTESSAWVLGHLPAARRAEILRAYFHPAEGLGYTFARTHINSCDFSVESWELAPRAGDHALEHFSLAPMRRRLMPLLHDAHAVAGKNLRFLAAPWSPPAWMKTNGTMLHGGQLRADCRDAWARHYVRFLDAMRDQEGIEFWGINVQNEPAATQKWESCIYSPEEERDFIRDHLGPALAASTHPDVKLLCFDHNRDILEAYAGAVFADPAAARHVWGAALHWYVSEDFDASRRLLAAFPEKNVLFSEGCWEGGVRLGQWDRGERYARNIIGDLNAGVCGWIDWNIVLDSTGGPNHVGNLCDAPVLVDRATQEVHFQSSFYYLGHFSRFIRPGARRIACTTTNDTLQVLACHNEDGTLAIVIHNPGAEGIDFSLTCGPEKIPSRIPAFAIQTYVSAQS